MIAPHSDIRPPIGFRTVAQALQPTLAALLLATAMVMAGCGGRDAGSPTPSVQATNPDPVEVRASSSIRVPVRRQLVATGTLNADEESVVSSKVTGRVVDLRVDLGDEVEVGALLALIDPVDAELALQERRLALAEAITQLGLDPEAGDALASVDEARLDLLPATQRARRQADNARDRLDRARVLLEQEPPLISAQDYADLRTAWEVAEQDHQLALLAARATLARARTLTAQVASAERVLDNTRILAPEGNAPPLPASFVPPLEDWELTQRWSIADRYVGVGTLVQPGTPLFRLVDVDPLRLRVAVPEHRIRQVTPNAVATVRADGTSLEVEGRVLRIAPTVNPRTRTFEVEIIVPNAERALRPGGFARAAIRAGQLDEALLVPVDSVVVFAGIEKAYAVVDGAAVERRVETGARFGDLIEIVRGLEADEMVIRSPGATLLAGTPVRVIERVAVSPPPTGMGG